MSFSSTLRYLALDPGLVTALFPELLSRYGEFLPDGDRQILTIGAFYLDGAKTHLVAASLIDGTIKGIRLTDGRDLFRFLPQSDLESDFLSNGINGVSELTSDQVSSLIPEIP